MGPGTDGIILTNDMIDDMSADEKLHKIQRFLQRPGPYLEYAPGPIISSKAIKAFQARVLDKNGIDFRTLIRISPWEVVWYGDWVLKSQCIDIVPTEPLFVHFASDEEIIRVRERKVTNEVLSQRFLGVALAARHQELLQI